MVNLISIIVPTFNRAHSIAKCIDSVRNQLCNNWELIIIDDGSNDNTREVVQIYLKDIRIKYFYQDNKGVSSARNAGASIASGGYLIFLDSDDIIYPNLIQTLINEKYLKYDIICWQVVKVIKAKKIIWKPKKLEEMYGGITASFLAGSICYNKQIFLNSGKYDENLSFGENYELGLRISQIEKLKIKLIYHPLSQYNLPFSRTSSSISNRLKSYIYLYDKHRDIYEKDPKSHSGINYLLGYIHEQTGQFGEAKRFYSRSSRIYRWNYKAHLKRLYFTLYK